MLLRSFGCVFQWGILALLLVLLPTGNANATPPAQSNIDFGQIVEGRITNEDYRQQYTFTGRAGQVATIVMERQSDDLDPYLLLVTQRGSVVAFSDDDGETRDAILRSITLPEDGVYTIIATRFGQEHGATIGDYTLELDVLGTAIAPVNDNSLLRYGDEVVGTITNEQPYIIYRLDARRGDVIDIALRRAGGDLDPQLDFFDPTGQFLINGDDDSSTGTLNARIVNYVIPSDGLYFIQATRYGGQRGTTTGLFTLEVNAIPTDQLGTRPGNARFLAVGDATTAVIDDTTFTRFFRFEANRGDIVTAVVQRLDGDLVPRVSLLRSDLFQLGSSVITDERADAASLPGISLAANGVYLVVVSRLGGVDGETQGRFSLQVNTRPGLAAEGALEIVYGGQISGRISADNFADRYLFVGSAGDRITLTMRQADGDLDPLLTLLDATEKQLIADDDSFAEDSQDARILDYELPADGIYYVEASRFQRVVGETEGDYTLTLTVETND